MYDELQGMMSTIPADMMHFPDEDGKERLDTMTIQDMDAASQATLNALFKAWMRLRTITSRHLSSLEKRWRRRTDIQRKAILVKVCPEIPPMHRPDFVALRKEFCSKETPFSLDIALRLPYVNLEDMCLPDTLIMFLESRSNNFPALFTNLDRSHLRVGIKSKILVPHYIRGHTMYMNGEQTREGYGRIVSWEEDRQSVFKCHSGVEPDPGMGLMILQVQRDILEFLVGCSAAIMHDIPLADLIKGPEQILENPSADQIIHEAVGRPTPTTSSIESLCVHMLEAPYRTPDMFNIARLQSLVQARRAEVEDRFFSIREDPGYFAEVIEHKDDIQPGKILPNAFVRAFSTLDFILENLIAVGLIYLPRHLSGAPSLKKQTHLKLSESRKPQKGQSYGCKTNKQICSIHSILQQIEILVTRNPREQDQLTPSLTEMISELSVVAEMQRELSLSSCNEYFLTAMPEEDILASIKDRMKPWVNIQDVVSDRDSFDLASTVKNLRVFDYPSDKPRTAANTEKMRRAEQALDHFWEQVNQHFVRKTGKTLKELEENKILHRNIERTPTWEEANTPKRDKNIVSKDTTDLNAARALANLEELTESTVEKGQAIEARQKVKTRNPAISNTHTGNPVSASENIDVGTYHECPKVKLRKKAYKAAFPIFAKVFGKLVTDELSGKVVDDVSGKIPWHQFITAMSRAGFGAEKFQGSRWLFDSGDRSIMFHEPHPESDLTTHLARRFARRLHRNFGWTADTFVLDNTSGGEVTVST
ncbi:MAG: hypothetical protein Q9221_002414 [Calogaya cf. arnoldii]